MLVVGGDGGAWLVGAWLVGGGDGAWPEHDTKHL